MLMRAGVVEGCLPVIKAGMRANAKGLIRKAPVAAVRCPRTPPVSAGHIAHHGCGRYTGALTSGVAIPCAASSARSRIAMWFPS